MQAANFYFDDPQATLTEIESFAQVTPEDVQRQFEKREVALQEAIQRIDSQLLKYKTTVPRLFMLEVEHNRAVLRAELEWLHGVIEDFRIGELFWNEEWIREIAERLKSQE